MADGGRSDVLGQKAQAAQRAFEARGMSLPKALRRALSRTADIQWDLALVTQDVAVEMLDQDEVIDALGPRDLLLLLDGPDGAVGIAAVDRQVLTGVIEVQTIQQVTQMPVDDTRPLTQTDAAMMAPLLDGALTRLADTLVDHPLHGQLAGFRFGAMIEDGRAAGLLLDAASYRGFRAEVDLALGRRRGVVMLFLPERKFKRSAPDEDERPGPHEERLSRVPARLSVALARVTLPLNKAEALKPGDLLPLPPDALDRVEVTAGSGHLVARGRLGQLNGLRAVRLNWPVTGSGAAAAGEAKHDGGMTDERLADFAGAAAGGAEPSMLPAAGPGDDGPTEDLPDLPAMDFAADAAGFDFEEADAEGGAEADAPPMDALPDIDMGGSFDAAAMDFDFDED